MHKPTTHEGIENNFKHHPPTTKEQEYDHAVIRAEFKKLAHLLINVCPESRELSLSMTKLEESMMWTNAALARNRVSDEETEVDDTDDATPR